MCVLCISIAVHFRSLTALESPQNTMYQIYPRIDTYACRTLEIEGGKGPTRRLLGKPRPELTMVSHPCIWTASALLCTCSKTIHQLHGQVLPDVTEERWHYNSSATIEDGWHQGVNARAYSWIVQEDRGYGEVTATYTFFVNKVDPFLAARCG